jgi:hypothetical protein
MTKLDRLRWLLANTKVEEDIPAIAELIRAEELREAKAFMESRDLTEALLHELQERDDLIAAMSAQFEALRADRLTSDVFTRVADWLKDPQRKPASTAFTSGIERQIAYALELDVLPHVKRMEIRVAKAERLLTDAQSLCNTSGNPW